MKEFDRAEEAKENSSTPPTNDSASAHNVASNPNPGRAAVDEKVNFKNLLATLPSFKIDRSI